VHYHLKDGITFEILDMQATNLTDYTYPKSQDNYLTFLIPALRYL